MALKDLQPGQGKVDVIVVVTEKSEPRTFNKFGKEGRVASSKVQDDSGSMTLTLWNDDIDKVDVGDKIHISNGYVGEWQGESQLSTGKFGKLELLEKGASAPEVKQQETAAPPAEQDNSSDDNDYNVEEENIDDLYDEEE